MSLVQKDTEIILCKNIPFDNSYTDVILFPTEATRIAYFNSKSVGNYSGLSYQKTNSNVFRLEVPYANTFDVSYCFFKNPNFGNRWFYAFITQVEYINNAVTEFTYEIDVMQTYFRTANLEQCFVEREHTNNDSVGNNILPEEFNYTEYVGDSIDLTSNLGSINTFMFYSKNFFGELITGSGSKMGKAYDGINIKRIGLTDLVEPQDVFNAVSINDITFNNVSNIVQAPFESDTVNRYKNGVIHIEKLIEGNIDGFKPKNNKIYTFPYNFGLLSSTNGSKMQLRYEFFSSSDVTIQYEGALTTSSPFIFYPINYKKSGSNNSISVNMGYNCTIPNETFLSQLAIGLATMPLNLVSEGLQFAAFSTTMGTTGSTTTTDVNSSLSSLHKQEAQDLKNMGNVLDLVNKGVKSALVPNSVSPSQDNAINGSITGLANRIYFEQLHLPINYLKQIDEYFTRFGYSTMRVKKPSITSRKYFNYIKTVACDTRVLAPAPDKSKIASIFDSGVTFWHLPNNTDDSIVGNYSLDNSIV